MFKNTYFNIIMIFLSFIVCILSLCVYLFDGNSTLWLLTAGLNFINFINFVLYGIIALVSYKNVIRTEWLN